MKLLTTLILISVGTYAQAYDAVCMRPRVMDNQLTVTVKNVGSGQESVEVFVPHGEYQGQRYPGTCSAVSGAMKCSVFSSTESGFEVLVKSSGNGRLTAEVTGWDMMGSRPVIKLPCQDLM